MADRSPLDRLLEEVGMLLDSRRVDVQGIEWAFLGDGADVGERAHDDLRAAYDAVRAAGDPFERMADAGLWVTSIEREIDGGQWLAWLEWDRPSASPGLSGTGPTASAAVADALAKIEAPEGEAP